MTGMRPSGHPTHGPPPPRMTIAIVLLPFRAVRRWLRDIRYHSARQRKSRWTRIMDAALLASPLVALAAAVGTNYLPGRSNTRTLLTGRVATTSAGEPVVWSVERTPDAALFLTPVGDFSVSQASIERGLPFAGMHIDAPPALDPFRPALRSQPTPPPAAAAAIESFIGRELPSDVAARYRAGESHSAMSLAGVAANFAVWWLVVLVATWLIVQSLRAMSSVGGAAGQLRTERRRRAGRCVQCGYDVRGSAWSARCPECGAVLGP